MKLDEVLEMIDIINDDTDITLIVDRCQIRGKWYDDTILKHCDKSVEMFCVHVTHNSAQIILT